MKRLIIALAVCGLLAAPGAAFADCLDGTAYTLQASGLWDANGNWSSSEASTCYPHNASDDAIFSDQADRSVSVNGNYTYASSTVYDSVTINFLNTDEWTLTTSPFSVTPDVAAATVTLTDAGTHDDELSISGALTMTAGDSAGEHAAFVLNGPDLTAGEIELNVASTDFNRTAEFEYDAGTVTVDILDLNGGNAALREAVLDIDATLDMTSGQSTDITVEGYCIVEVAENYDFTVDEVEVVATEDVPAYMDKLEAGDFMASQLTLTGGPTAGDTVTFKVTGGTFIAQ